AAARTLAAGSARFRMQVHGGAAMFSTDATGVIDFRRSRALLEFTIGTPGRSFGGYAPKEIAFRLAGRCEYFRNDSGLSGVSGDKPWGRIDLARVSGQIGIGFAGSDPAEALRSLRRAHPFRR